MANECLVTKLKGVVNNDNLPLFNKLRIKFEASNLMYNPMFRGHNLPEGKTLGTWISENVSVKDLNGQDIQFVIAANAYLEFTSPNSGGIIYINDKAHFGDFSPNASSTHYGGYKFVSDEEYRFQNCFPLELWPLYNEVPVTLSPASSKIIDEAWGDDITIHYYVIANVAGAELLNSTLTLAENAPRITRFYAINKVTTPLSWLGNFPNLKVVNQDGTPDVLSGNLADLGQCLHLGDANDASAYFKPTSSLVTGSIADLCDALKANGKKNSAFQYALYGSPNIVNIPGAVPYQEDRYHVDFDANGDWTVYTGN